MFVLRRITLAFQTLTRIPLPVTLRLGPRDIPGAVAYYPLAGLAIGALSWAAAYAMLAVTRSAPLSAIVSLAAMTVLTGALHIDGFADCCDGLGSGARGEKALAIMKDSRLGTAGVLGVLFIMGLRFVLALEAMNRGLLPAMLPALALAPCVAKTAVALSCWGNRYARPDGANKPVVNDCAFGEFACNAALMLIAVVVIACCCSLALWKICALAVAAVLLGFTFSKGMAARLGGVNGDVLGGSNEIAELAFLFGLLWLG